jgi:hypothetical protein
LGGRRGNKAFRVPDGHGLCAFLHDARGKDGRVAKSQIFADDPHAISGS